MKRKYSTDLHAWLNRKKRKPLVLRGARQVGKSTLVKLFAQEVELELVEINLEIHRALDSIFATLDLELIIKSLEGLVGHSLQEGQLLFLDEIQATPNALAALRYFYEKMPKLPVIAAGSLLEFTLSQHSFSMPVGRIEYLHITPMTFSEYLGAIDSYALEQLQCMELDTPMTESIHQRLLKHQRDYFLVGGMPEAVDTYKESRSLEDAFRVQNDICATYMDDFSKYAQERELADLQIIFRSLPVQLGKKIKYTALLPDRSSSHCKKLLQLLTKAKIASIVTHSGCNGTPLAAEINPKHMKAIFLDIGLVSRILKLDWRDLNTTIDVNHIHGGALAEQFIGQHLNWNPNEECELYYWTKESKNSNAELDYVSSRGTMIIPIEVKSGKAGSMKSLHQFMYEKKLLNAFRFDSLPPSSQMIQTKVTTKASSHDVTYHLTSLPLYAVEQLPRFIDELRDKTATMTK
jgi:predicted AAA+ superfamily ATPase